MSYLIQKRLYYFVVVLVALLVMVELLFHQIHWRSSSRTKIYFGDSFNFIKAKRSSIISYQELQNQILAEMHSSNTTEFNKEISGTSNSSEKHKTSSEHLVTLPFPGTTLSAKQLFKKQWVKDLQIILSDIPRESPPVHIIAGNYDYREVLLNWLITAKVHAKPPITNIIILSIDRILCDILRERNTSCIFVEQKHIFREETVLPVHLILVLRLTTIRLLNYWGYDAANLDTDALILKNPELLYNDFIESDLVAGHGIYPYELGAKWGHTICGGTFMIRSSPSTEIFWRYVSKVSLEGSPNAPEISARKLAFDDQVLLNYALLTMDPLWEDIFKEGRDDSDSKILRATTEVGFTVTLVSEDMICRKKCTVELKSRYYVWHKSGKKQMKKKAERSDAANLWFLKKDWTMNVTSSATGEQWLKEISVL